MRLQLLKQDEVARLEEQLNTIDRGEKRSLFLGNCRRDTNQERKAVVERLSRALEEYGKLQTCCCPRGQQNDCYLLDSILTALHSKIV